MDNSKLGPLTHPPTTADPSKLRPVVCAPGSKTFSVVVMAGVSIMPCGYRTGVVLKPLSCHPALGIGAGMPDVVIGI